MAFSLPLLVQFISSMVVLCLALTANAAPNELNKRASRTTAPSGCLAVGSGAQYTTVKAALTALGTSSTASACIFIGQGTYAEQLTINYKGPLTLYGYTTDTSSYSGNKATITHSLNSATAGSLDLSSTVNIVSANFKAYNINFVNSYGQGSQAVAVTANGDKQSFYGCSFKSYQDTLYAKLGKQYYSKCYIEGATDWIFGDATAWFSKSTVASIGPGYVTAQKREVESDTSWYVFDQSTITNGASVSASSLAGKVYLGRPWRILARVQYQYCSLSAIINPEGWTTMSTAPNATPVFLEYQNTGAGSDTSKRVMGGVAKSAVTQTQIWGSGWESWVDTSY